MSNEAPITPAAPVTPVTPAAPAAPITPAAPVTPPATPASPETPPADGKPAEPKPWQVPEAYKDKPWAAKVKSEEDLYKQIDNLTGLVGKKTVALDYTTATPEEITAHHKALAPADAADYKFDTIEGIDVERMDKVAPILQKAGLTVNQAQTVASEYAKFENSILAEATSADGFKDQMTKSFGEKYEGAVASVVALHKAHLSPEDAKLMDAMPNEYLGGVYRLTQKMAEAHKAEVTALKKQYGAEENGDAHLNRGGNVPEQTKEQKRAVYIKELSVIDDNPFHTAAQRQTVLDKIQALYK